MTRGLRTNHEWSRKGKPKGGLWQTGAPTRSLIKTAFQAVSTLPVGGMCLREVVLLKGRQLREERMGVGEVNGRRRMGFGYDTYIIPLAHP